MNKDNRTQAIILRQLITLCLKTVQKWSSENKTDAYLQKEKQQKLGKCPVGRRGLLKSRKRLQGSRQVNAAIRKLHKQKITAVKQASNHSGILQWKYLRYCSYRYAEAV